MRMKPAFSELREEFPELKWTSINILDDPTGITQKYGVKQIPAMVVDNGSIEKACGSNIADYYRILKTTQSSQ